jgi:hypothetical protein
MFPILRLEGLIPAAEQAQQSGQDQTGQVAAPLPDNHTTGARLRV